MAPALPSASEGPPAVGKRRQAGVMNFGFQVSQFQVAWKLSKVKGKQIASTWSSVPASGLGPGLVCAEVYRKGPVPLLALRSPWGERKVGVRHGAEVIGLQANTDGERRYLQAQPGVGRRLGQLLLQG